MRCPNCKAELKAEMKFCTNCGQQLTPQAEEQGELQSEQQPVLQPEEPNVLTRITDQLDKQTIVPLFGLAGIAIVFVAIFSLIDPDIRQIDFLQLLIGLSVLGGILLVSALYLVFTGRLNALSQVLLLATGEGILFAVLYLYDLVYRSQLSRYGILGGVIVIFLIGMLLPRLKQMDFPGRLLELGSTYVGFIMIINLSGSDYYSREIFSVTLLVVILLTHYVIIETESIYLLFWAVPLEFFTLLQSSVINSTLIFPTALLIILSIPLLLFLKRSESFQLYVGTNSVLELVFVFPQLALVFVLTRGILVFPQAQILIGLFLVCWVLYLLLLKRGDKLQKKESTAGWSSIYAILIVALLGFSLDGQEITSIFLIFIVFVIPVFYSGDDLFEYYKIGIYLSTFLSFFLLVNYNDADPLLFYVILIGGMILHLGVLYAFGFMQIRDLQFPYYQVWLVLITIWMAVSKVDALFYLVINVGLQLAINEFRGKDSMGDLITSVMVSIPTIFVTFIPDIGSMVWLLLGLQGLSIVVFLISPRVVDRFLTTNIAVLPLIFILSLDLSVFYLNIILVSMIGLAIIFLLLDSTSFDHQLISSSLFVISIILRDVISIEGEMIFGLSMQIVTLLGILAIFTAVYFIQLVRDFADTNRVVMTSFWVGIVLYLINSFSEMEELELTRYLFFGLTSVIVLLFGLRAILNNQGGDIHEAVLVILFLISTYLNSYLDYYYIPWIAFTGILVIDNITTSIEEDIKLRILYPLVYFVNMVTIAGVQDYLLSASLVLILTSITLPGRVSQTLEYYLPSKYNVASVILTSAVLFILLDVFHEFNYLDNLHVVIVYSLLILQLGFWIRTQSFDGLALLTAMIIALGAIYLQQTVVLSWLIFGGSSVVLLYCIYQDTSIGQATSSGFIPAFNFTVLSITFIYLIEVVQLGSLLINDGYVGFELYNQILVGLGLLVVAISALVMRSSTSTNLTDALLLAGGGTFVISNFIGFYDVVISNILYGSVALITAFIGLMAKRRDIYYFGVALSGLSVLRAIIDWFVLVDTARSLSLLVVGIQIIIHTIVFNNLDETSFADEETDQHDAVPAKE